MRSSRRRQRSLPAALRLAACQLLLLPVLLVLSGPEARGGGFEHPVQGTHALGRGGAFTARADDPTAAFWNPALLARQRGSRFLYNHGFSQLGLTFARADQRWWDYQGSGRTHSYEFAPSEEQTGFFALGMAFFVTTDFGLPDWSFALGLVGPSSIGQGSMGGEDAATRYSYLDMDILLLFATASAAWRHEDLFGFGASLQYASLPRLRYGFVVVGPTLAFPEGESPNPVRTDNDLLARVEMSDPFALSAIAGAWLRPLPYLQLGVSSRVVPVSFAAHGDVTLQGQPGGLFAQMEPAVLPATVSFHLPATFQAGVRYFQEQGGGGGERFDVELDFVWENWSSVEGYDIEFGMDRVRLLSAETELVPLRIPRYYQDTFSLRLGGEHHLLPGRLALRGGVFWESAASPPEWTVPDFPSFDRLGLAAGASLSAFGLELAFAYAHIFQLPREVGLHEGRIRQQVIYSGEVRQGAVVNAGRYESGYDVIAIGVTAHFEELPLR